MKDCLYWEMEKGTEPIYDAKLRKATPLMRMIIIIVANDCQ